MNELDEKLEETLKKGTFVSKGADKVFFTFDGIIEEVKQAFIDDGWVEKLSSIHGVNVVVDHNLMTGEEWLARFEQEIPTWSQGDRTALGFERVYLEAAKRVSGDGNE